MSVGSEGGQAPLQGTTGPLKRLVAIVTMLLEGGFLNAVSVMRSWFGEVKPGEVLELFSRIITLVRTLPNEDDEKACRDWCLQAMLAADKISHWTRTEADDQAVEWFEKAIRNDEVWKSILYPSLRWVLVSDGEKQPMSPNLEASTKAGIDPGTIMLIVSTIMELIQLFRKVRDTIS